MNMGVKTTYASSAPGYRT